MSVKLVVVTGNIGSGKTTTLRQIQTWVEEKGLEQHVTIIMENVIDWNFYLKKFYETYKNKNAARRNEFGFLLQMQVLSHYHNVTKQIQEIQDRCDTTHQDHYVFVERSPFDAKEVFIDTNREVYTPKQYKLLSGLVEEYVRLWMWHNAVYVQIVTPTDECCLRIKKRDRDGESQITPDYMSQLEEAYKQLAFKIDMKTLSVGVNETPEAVARSICAVAGVEKMLENSCAV